MFVRVAKVEELPPGSRKAVNIDGNFIVVFNVAGQIFAIDDMCTHDAAYLSEGNLEGFEVECPWHGSRFDVRTGDVLTMPATEGVNTYEVLVKDGDIHVSKEPRR